MTVCNSCRYCEGLCAVFPTMEMRRSFSDGDLNYLANLCHSCGACYTDCQFSPPHEFDVNVPKTLAIARAESYAAYAWPRAFSGLFAPYWKSSARGVIAGLTRYVNGGHIARASLEATAFQSREVSDAMNADSGVELESLKVDGGIFTDLGRVPELARELEHLGYDAAWTGEINHDPFFPLLLGAEHTSRLELGTSIAVAFARNPMNVANIGWDVQAYSEGRFILGLGSQIKPHIENRFSMPWSRPVQRMRE